MIVAKCLPAVFIGHAQSGMEQGSLIRSQSQTAFLRAFVIGSFKAWLGMQSNVTSHMGHIHPSGLTFCYLPMPCAYCLPRMLGKAP